MNTLIFIDYLILNFKGKLHNPKIFDKNTLFDIQEKNPFSFELENYGTSIFSTKHNVYYQNKRLGVCLSSPRSSILDIDFIQFQFDNTIFYTHTLDELKTIVNKFTEFHQLEFTSVNRLDIAVDKQQNYKQVYNDVIQGNLLISGRSKSINSYYETHKGQSVLNGFTIGKRNSSRFLRIYNKTLSLQLQPKDYITQIHKKNFSSKDEIWRFEFQLNSKFFADLYKLNKYNDSKEKLTIGIFDINTLIDLLKLAEKNFFELTTNTGKSQTNKEQKIVIHCWESIRKHFKTLTNNVIVKVKKVFELSTLIHKRLAKSLFRIYYINNQDMDYLHSLYKHLLTQNLISWFDEKFKFYISEFHQKEKIILFDKKLFYEHKQQLLNSYKKAITI